MCPFSGGHFAGAVFERKEAVIHKTFHKYIVRKKAGKVQSVRDGKWSFRYKGKCSKRHSRIQLFNGVAVVMQNGLSRRDCCTSRYTFVIEETSAAIPCVLCGNDAQALALDVQEIAGLLLKCYCTNIDRIVVREVANYIRAW